MTKRRLRVYVAGPLSNGEKASTAEINHNISRASSVGYTLLQKGFAPLVPHLNMCSVPMCAANRDDLLEMDFEWIKVADAVLRLPGESEGAEQELKVASEYGVPVFYNVEDLETYRNDYRANVWSEDTKVTLVGPAPTDGPKGDPRFHALLKEIGELHDKKQADYGSKADPFANVRGSTDWGIEAWRGAMIRANDKVKRLQKYAACGELANESVRDSFLDLAVYALIACVLWEETHCAAHT